MTDWESEQLDRIRSAPRGSDLTLEVHRAFKMAEQGRKMTLLDLCVSKIMQDRAKLVTQPNSFTRLPATLVQLILDECSIDCDTFRALLQQLFETGCITKLELLDEDSFWKYEDVSWLVRTMLEHCPRMQHLCGRAHFCFSLESECVLRSVSVHSCKSELFPLEHLRHLTRLSFHLCELVGRDQTVAGAIARVVGALPALKYLDCNELTNFEVTPQILAELQPLLQHNQRVLELKELTLHLPDLQTDLISNLRVRELVLYGGRPTQHHLGRLSNLSGVRVLQLYSVHPHSFYPLVELLGPRGLESLRLSNDEYTVYGRQVPLYNSLGKLDLIRLISAAPSLSQLVIDIWDQNMEILPPTKKQLKDLNFEKMKRFHIHDECSALNSLLYLEQLVLRSEQLETLVVDESAQIMLVLRLLKSHSECCTRVQNLSVLFGADDDTDAAVELMTRVVLRSPTLQAIELDDFGKDALRDKEYRWFFQLLLSNQIDIGHNPLQDE